MDSEMPLDVVFMLSWNSGMRGGLVQAAHPAWVGRWPAGERSCAAACQNELASTTGAPARSVPQTLARQWEPLQPPVVEKASSVVRLPAPPNMRTPLTPMWVYQAMAPGSAL
jgi:hypothetical protein